jgi:hypothetical protein
MSIETLSIKDERLTLNQVSNLLDLTRPFVPFIDKNIFRSESPLKAHEDFRNKVLPALDEEKLDKSKIQPLLEVIKQELNDETKFITLLGKMIKLGFQKGKFIDFDDKLLKASWTRLQKALKKEFTKDLKKYGEKFKEEYKKPDFYQRIDVEHIQKAFLQFIDELKKYKHHKAAQSLHQFLFFASTIARKLVKDDPHTPDKNIYFISIYIAPCLLEAFELTNKIAPENKDIALESHFMCKVAYALLKSAVFMVECNSVHVQLTKKLAGQLRFAQARRDLRIGNTAQKYTPSFSALNLDPVLTTMLQKEREKTIQRERGNSKLEQMMETAVDTEMEEASPELDRKVRLSRSFEGPTKG